MTLRHGNPQLQAGVRRKRWITTAACALTAGIGFGWGEPHVTITRAALEALPGPDRALFGREASELGAKFCLIPDNVYSDTNDAKFAMMDSRPGVKYILTLHLPSSAQAENLEVLRYFLGRSVAALKAGHPGDAARFAGSLCHALEDWGSPAHTVPGDNMFTLLQQFLPPPEAMAHKLLHSPIESGRVDAAIPGYAPRLLGTSLDEAGFRLLHRAHEGVINARTTTIPIIHALYAGDSNAVAKWQSKAASQDAEIVADALHTICRLAAGTFDTSEAASLAVVDLSRFWPGEATNLYYSQAMFTGSPNWGHPTSGYVLERGTNAVPLRLRVEEHGAFRTKEFTEGIAVGIGRPITHPLPPGIYSRFTVLAGLQAGLGAKGRVKFTVTGDGRELASAELAGDSPARTLDCPISGVTNLQLLAGALPGGEAGSNYAVWAEPRLHK